MSNTTNIKSYKEFIGESFFPEGHDQVPEGSRPGDSLESAVKENNVELIEILLNKGADPNTPTQNGMTPLELAIRNGNADVVQLLIDFGADPQQEGQRSRMTPLHKAVAGGSTDVIDVLLANGADPFAVDLEGTSPVDLAREMGRDDIADRLETY
jgi:cytohesin